MGIDRAAISAAARLLAGHVRRTPVLRLAAGELGLAVPLALKLEFLQHSGSFKPRGAFHRMLTARLPAAGVIAASGGNHGAAVAYAAARLGVTAEIFVPEATPAAKCDRIAGFGATLVRAGSTYAEALAASRLRQAQTGALEVHAYDDAAVLAGQGTVGMELAADAPELTHVLVATGGGGLIGGIAAWYGDAAAVISVEPQGCATLAAALAAGRPVDVATGGIAADSLGARRLGAATWPIAQAHIAAAVTVSDPAIAAAQALLWEALRIAVEPGGATALAALTCGALTPPPGARVGVILCGANVARGV
jgi:threonine dehydratase